MLHYKSCPVLRTLVNQWIPGVANLPGPWRQVLEDDDGWFLAVSLMGPRRGQDRDFVCATLLYAFLKTHAHHRLGTRGCPKAIFLAILRLAVRRYKKLAKVLSMRTN